MKVVTPPPSGDGYALLLAQAKKYGAVGLVNTAVGLSVIFAALWLGYGDIAANVIGYAAGLTTSFILNRSWTFAHDGHWLASLARFLVVFAVAYALNLAAVLVAHRVLGINVYLAQFFGVAVYAVAGFLGSRIYAFPQREGG